METTKLEKLRACREAIEWVKTCKSPEDAWNNCSRGDWMLWLAKKLDVDDRKLTLAKVRCAEQVKHLMKDQRSLDALDACFRYAKGELTRDELNAYAYDAAYAADAPSYASYAAYADASAASAAASAAYASAADASDAASAAADASDATYAAARTVSLRKSADICREVLTEDILEKYENKDR